MATKPHSATETIHRTGRSNSVTGAAAGADHEAAAPRMPSQRTPEELAQMAANSIGAQIILDYNSDAALGARGGRGGTIEENTLARDADLIAVGLDPNAPSGPPTGVPWEPPVQVTRQATGPAATGKATRMSSLAAGIITDADDLPTPPGGSNGSGGTTAPVNRDVPHVTQSGDTLNCTMGNWEGEPTSYGYQWKIDGAVAGTDSATHTVAAADVGKAATCVVTATNAHGSTAAPPSNEVVITDPATAGGQSRSKR
jgi:hypothetical protein